MVDITGCGVGVGGSSKKTSLFLFFHGENLYCHALKYVRHRNIYVRKGQACALFRSNMVDEKNRCS